MKTLITGATGFVGAAVLRELLKKGHKVKALVRQSSILDNLKNLDVETVQGDLIDRDSLKLALKDCKYLFHVAADYRLWVPKSEEIYLNNVKGTENLMEEALSSGDKILSENYFQHADHFSRIIKEKNLASNENTILGRIDAKLKERKNG